MILNNKQTTSLIVLILFGLSCVGCPPVKPDEKKADEKHDQNSGDDDNKDDPVT
jgi:hypothetical protein